MERSRSDHMKETSSPAKSKVAVSLPKNPVNRLQYREVGGLHRHQKRTVRYDIFHKLPGRLAFSLTSLVPQSVLDDGHVFLGFARNGQFVLSYTLNLEADDHAPYPVNSYKLQCWQFVPYRRLRKISEIRLFGEEDIQQELFLSVCEWPLLNDRLVIHGYSAGAVSDGDEKRHCYITIAALPPLNPCDKCAQLSTQYSHGYDDAEPRCLQHSFAIHTRYEVAPPYPPFVPHMSLACSGIVVINTGDSLVAVGALVDDGDRQNSLLTSTLICDTGSSSCASSIANCDDLGDDETAMAVDSLAVVSSPGGMSAVSHRSGMEQCSRPKDATNTPATTTMESRFFRERHLSTGKENQLKVLFNAGSPAIAVSPSQEQTSCRQSARGLDVYNFDCGMSKCSGTDDECGESDSVALPNTLNAMRMLRSTQCHSKHSATVNNMSGSDNGDSADSSNIYHSFEDFCEPSTANVFDRASTYQPHLSMALPPRLLDVGGVNVASFYPSFNNWGASPGRGTNSTCSSCLSSPFILQNNTQCFTYSVRRYVSASILPGAPDIDDDGNLAYHSLLPMEVHSTAYSTMRLVTKQAFLPHTPFVTVKQLTFDVEHYLGEAVKTCADWGHRYLSFTDYDVQIIEVCADTAEVLAVVYVLIRARPADDLHHKHHHGTRTLPKMYLTAFKLVWNLTTGSYKTLDVKDLVEVNQTQMMRNHWNWKQWGRQLSDAIHRRFSVPLAPHQMAHVLTNEAVFRGQSLKMLLDRQHYVAILL